MTVAFFPNDAQPAKIRPLTWKPPIRLWQEELNDLENEITFYHKLLSLNTGHGNGRPKSPLFTLMSEFSTLLETTLPEMKTALLALSQHPVESLNQISPAFQKQLDQLKQELQKLKTSVFPLIIHLQRITIW